MQSFNKIYVYNRNVPDAQKLPKKDKFITVYIHGHMHATTDIIFEQYDKSRKILGKTTMPAVHAQ